MNAITAVYRLTCDYGEVERLSRDIAVEQTVEVPESLILNRQVVEDIVGRVETIEQTTDGSDAFDVSIEYNTDLSAYQIGQTLNLVYGNISRPVKESRPGNLRLVPHRWECRRAHPRYPG